MKYLFVAILVLIALALVLMMFFAYMANKYRSLLNTRRREEIFQASYYRKKNPKPSNKEDHRSKDKKQEQKKESAILTGVELYDPRQEQEVDVQNPLAKAEDVKIVGVAKPVGFWSRFVMKQKLGFIMARMQMQQNKGSQGFWVNLIKAQATSQSKQQGRGR
jgi:hypothetical protein